MMTYGSSDARRARAAESHQLSGSGLFGSLEEPLQNNDAGFLASRITPV